MVSAVAPGALRYRKSETRKSLLVRVMNRTPVAARENAEAVILYLVQPGPEGGALAGEGGHGSIIPRAERIRSPNDMG
jgi:hypothetical protein